MAKKLTYDIGYYSYAEFEKLKTIFNGDEGREGIVVTCDINVPDWNNLVITLESDKYTDKVKMLDMFSAVLAVELLDRI